MPSDMGGRIDEVEMEPDQIFVGILKRLDSEYALWALVVWLVVRNSVLGSRETAGRWVRARLEHIEAQTALLRARAEVLKEARYHRGSGESERDVLDRPITDEGL